MALLGALAFFAIHAVTECTGCHTARRDVPPSRFDVGLGHWQETQCVGCHHEMNQVAREGVVFGQKGPSYWTLPLSEERRAEIVAQPLSFTSAPLDIALTSGPFLRIDSLRLLDFLQRPVDVRRASDEHDRMMAFPSLTWADMSDLVRGISGRGAPMSMGSYAASAGPGSAAPADTDTDSMPVRELWATRCRGCHESTAALSGRPPEYLALFTADWIYAYANGLGPRPGGAERSMPVVPISQRASRALYDYFGALRDEKAKALDVRINASSTAAVDKRTAGRRLTEEEVSFVWGPLLREGKCVHCHAAEGHRAFQKLAGTPRGLANYVRDHGGMAIWRRLEVRALEVETGMTASAPGMPMTGEPLSQNLRDLIYVWAREGCPAPSGRKMCGPAPASPKKT